MKNILHLMLVLIFFACSDKKSETEILKDELDNQKQLIEEQKDKILKLENNQQNVNPVYEEENKNESNYEHQEVNVIANVDIKIKDLISFISQENDAVEIFLINKSWVYVEKGEKQIILKKKRKFLKYKNQNSDSQIEIKDFSGIRNVKFTTTNQENLKELQTQLESNNFKLVNPNYKMGKQFNLSEPQVGQNRLINSTAELYSDGKNEITINYNIYAIVNRVENDSKGTYFYSQNSQYNSYEISFK